MFLETYANVTKYQTNIVRVHGALGHNNLSTSHVTLMIEIQGPKLLEVGDRVGPPVPSTKMSMFRMISALS